MCIKGAHGKLENIKRELDREKALKAKAQERQAAGLRINPRWLDLFALKIERLQQLVEILEREDVPDGSPVLVAEIGELPQFDPIAFGKVKHHSDDVLEEA